MKNTRASVLILEADPVRSAGLATTLSGFRGVSTHHAGRDIVSGLDSIRGSADLVIANMDGLGASLRELNFVLATALPHSTKLFLLVSRANHSLLYEAYVQRIPGLSPPDLEPIRLCKSIIDVLGGSVSYHPDLMDIIRRLMVSSSFISAPEFGLNKEVLRPGLDHLRFEMGALTPREVQILSLIHRGLTNRSIATVLGISVKTVEIHVTSLLRKTGASSRVQLAVLAERFLFR